MHTYNKIYNIDAFIDRWIDRWIVGSICRWLDDRQMDRCKDRLVDRLIDIYIERLIDTQKDRQPDINIKKEKMIIVTTAQYSSVCAPQCCQNCHKFLSVAFQQPALCMVSRPETCFKRIISVQREIANNSYDFCLQCCFGCQV